MATTNIKRVVANTLATHIASNVIGLAGKVSAVAAGPESTMPCLSVKIIPDTFVYEPSDADEVYWDEVTDDKRLILDVGRFSGRFTIELYATSPAERESYEQAIMDLFLATEWAPGTLFLDTPALTVAGIATLYQAQVKIRLEDETWLDEMAFEGKRYSFLEVSVDLPALTANVNAPTIESLQTWLTSGNLEVETTILEPE